MKAAIGNITLQECIMKHEKFWSIMNEVAQNKWSEKIKSHLVNIIIIIIIKGIYRAQDRPEATNVLSTNSHPSGISILSMKLTALLPGYTLHASIP